MLLLLVYCSRKKIVACGTVVNKYTWYPLGCVYLWTETLWKALDVDLPAVAAVL
jgi:hypothetical protein